MNAHNTFARPEAVCPADFEDFKLRGRQLELNLPPMSVVRMTLTV